MNSIFSNNVATYGSAIDISHSYGNCDINENFIVNNTAINPATKLGAGAIIKVAGTLELLVKFWKNIMINNLRLDS